MKYDLGTTDHGDNPKLDRAWDLHQETCEYCVNLAGCRHLENCSECGHPWHGGKRCPDTVEVRAAGSGHSDDLAEFEPCECEEDGGLSDSHIEDLQQKCFEDYQQGRAEDAADASYDRWRDRDI